MIPKDTELNHLEEKPSLTRKQQMAIPHLIAARSLEAGCREANLSKGTLYRWLKDENFKNELERARTQVTQEAFQRLITGVSTAVDGLLEIAEDRDEKNKSVRLRACEKILDLALRIREVDELVEGLKQKLEERMADRSGGSTSEVDETAIREVRAILLQVMREKTEEGEKYDTE